MKCISCGNLIPDASTICPFCNNKVEPVAAPTPVFNVNNQVNTATPGAVIPDTPTQPVLPQDQGMNVAAPQTVEPVAPVNQGVQVAPTPDAQVNPMAAGANPVNVSTAPETMPAPGNGQVQQQVFEPVAAPTTADLAPTQNPAPTPTPTDPVGPTGVVPEGVIPTPIPDGAKIGSAAPKEKKNKLKKLIIIILIILVIAAIGGGVFYYFTQYKTAEKRIDEVVNAIFRNSVSVKNDNVELAKGTYSLEGSMEIKEEKYGIKLNGLYGYDLANGIMDFTLNLESINFGGELLDAGPLNLEMYVQDSNIYFLLQNFYDKYIYYEVENINELFDSIEQNDINYQTIMMGLREATKAAVKSTTYTQTVENVSLNGKKSKANVVRIALNEEVYNKMSDAALNSLANNQAFIAEIAKLTGEEEATIKESLTNQEPSADETVTDEEETTPTEGTLEIYTAMFGNGFVGAKIDIKDEAKTTLEIYPVMNGYGFAAYENNKKIMEFEGSTAKNITSTSEENNSTFTATIYDEENGAMKLNLTMEVIKDSNPKIEKVNVKNSINAQYLTPQQILSIYDKAASHGSLGVIIQSLLGTTMEQYRTQITTPIVPSTSGSISTITP